MAKKISIRKAAGTWVVRAGGAVLGESREALELAEDGYPEVIYFPRADVAMAFLERSDRRTTCPHKGEASYYNIVTNNQTLPDRAWSYEDPTEDMARIRGHLAFHADGDDVAVERV
jgi:uncharacterized protein (DUF427 family)